MKVKWPLISFLEVEKDGLVVLIFDEIVVRKWLGLGVLRLAKRADLRGKRK
ncbi:hypothetical protein QE357_004036 [Siphonobacter sp. BAB-5404]|nr:hypothetical protein [Siphonobacter sp. SORGH_AS_0500]